MIGAVSTNGLLAALFGPGKTPAPHGKGQADAPGGAADDALSQASPYGQPVDVVELSGRAKSSDAAASVGVSPTPSKQAAGQPGITGSELTKEEKQQVEKLKQRDAEVRRHEQAHKAAAGGNANGGPTFEFQTGPDGKRYAVGGEVSIDTSEVSGDPQATIQKMQQIRRAALAPAQPSGQDRAVAAQAQATEQAARAELAKERRDSVSGRSSKPGGLGTGSAFQLNGSQHETSTSSTQLDLVA